jgi:hypothetical protein
MERYAPHFPPPPPQPYPLVFLLTCVRLVLRLRCCLCIVTIENETLGNVNPCVFFDYGLQGGCYDDPVARSSGLYGVENVEFYLIGSCGSPSRHAHPSSLHTHTCPTWFPPCCLRVPVRAPPSIPPLPLPPPPPPPTHHHPTPPSPMPPQFSLHASPMLHPRPAHVQPILAESAPRKRPRAIR